MKPRFRAEPVVVSEELLILASCLLRLMSRNSVLEEFSVRRHDTFMILIMGERVERLLEVHKAHVGAR